MRVWRVEVMMMERREKRNARAGKMLVRMVLGRVGLLV
jgi:hypothetical protein